VAPLGVAHCAEIVHRDLKPANISTSTEEIPLGQKQKLSSIHCLRPRGHPAREVFRYAFWREGSKISAAMAAHSGNGAFILAISRHALGATVLPSFLHRRQV
jgi:serine/threonine protein kinase